MCFLLFLEIKVPRKFFCVVNLSFVLHHWKIPDFNGFLIYCMSLMIQMKFVPLGVLNAVLEFITGGTKN